MCILVQDPAHLQVLCNPIGPAQHTTAQHAKRSVHTKKRARGGVMQLELQGRDRRRDRATPVGHLQGFLRHGHPPREPRLPPRACSPAGWLFGAPKSTFLTSNRPPEAISDRSLRGSQNGMSRMRRLPGSWAGRRAALPRNFARGQGSSSANGSSGTARSGSVLVYTASSSTSRA